MLPFLLNDCLFFSVPPLEGANVWDCDMVELARCKLLSPTVDGPFCNEVFWRDCERADVSLGATWAKSVVPVF